MKKILMLSVLLVGLTACTLSKTKTLTCSYANTYNGLTSKIKYDIDHEDNEIKKIHVTYNYMQDTTTSQMDGVGTGTDGTTNDTQPDNDGIVDGIVGNAIDVIVNGVTSTILDISGLRSRHSNIQSTYGNMNGFSYQNTTDVDNNYIVTYVIDFDNMTDSDINSLNFDRDLDTVRDTYTNQGFTCSE